MRDIPVVKLSARTCPRTPSDEQKTSGLAMTPLPHQQRLSGKLTQHTGQVAFHGLGSGKSMSAINAAEEQKSPLVAIVPASLRNNMRKEIQAAGFKRPHMVLSYEQALKKLDDPEFQNFAENAVVAFDESHRSGHAESLRSKLPSAVRAKKKLFLTGTPIRNHPVEIAPVVNAIQPGSLPTDKKDFDKFFIKTREIPVGFWGMLRGDKPKKVREPTNLHWFEHAVKGKVDYHEDVDRKDFPSFSESVVEVPMSDRQQATYNYVLGKYPRMAYKIRHGLPLNKTEHRSLRSFMVGPRQVSNHPGVYNRRATDLDAPKIIKMVDEIEQRAKDNKHYRGVTYSTYLGSGVEPLSRELERRNIPHAIFTGDTKEEDRKKIVEDYNKGKIKHLLISGAGAEGLDLKGTRLMQITEPHWNESMIDQVRGRAIRYKSHSHLPEKDRHVEVQRFHAIPQKSMLDKMLRRRRSSTQGVDEYLTEMANEKYRINEPFMRILKGEPAPLPDGLQPPQPTQPTQPSQGSVPKPEPEKQSELVTGVTHVYQSGAKFAAATYGTAVYEAAVFCQHAPASTIPQVR